MFVIWQFNIIEENDVSNMQDYKGICELLP